MKRAIVTVSNDLVTDNRVKRTCSVLGELGFDVLLVGRTRKNSLPLNFTKYNCKRFKLIFENGPLFYAELNIRLFLFLLFQKVDVLYSNDLDTLPANFFVSKIKSKSKLIYDTHELFTEVPELENRKFAKNTWVKIEKYIFPKLNHVITVNESIANIYKTKYGKPILVVRNVPEKFESSNPPSKSTLGLPEDKFILIIQGSGLNVDRGIEEAVLSMQFIENALLIIVGSGDVIPKIKKMVIQKNLDNKVKFYEKRPYLEMMQLTSKANIGLTLDKPLSDNYKYSLPNKLFDYIQAGVPILSSELVELQKIIDKYNIGYFVETVSPEEIAKNVNFLIENPEKLNVYKLNCIKAAEIENWEHEKIKLKKLIEEIS
ncbi:MAG: glycosyltransferase [Bacteroidetes bacterium]|nr:glycosyltransferase [Bacteroidota bacterium]